MFNRKYIFISGPFSIAMLDYRSVTFSELHLSMFEHTYAQLLLGEVVSSELHLKRHQIETG